MEGGGICFMNSRDPSKDCGKHVVEKQGGPVPGGAG